MSDETRKLMFIAVGAAAFAGSFLLVRWARKRQKTEEESEDIPAIAENEEYEGIRKMERSSLDNGFPKMDPDTVTLYWNVKNDDIDTKTVFNEEGPAENDGEHLADDTPYMITADEFANTKDGYKSVGLYYFADRLVADKDFELIDGIDSVIGFESLNHFGPGADTVYIRNDRLKTDYEIVQDERRYIDVIAKKSGDTSGGSD